MRPVYFGVVVFFAVFALYSHERPRRQPKREYDAAAAVAQHEDDAAAAKREAKRLRKLVRLLTGWLSFIDSILIL